MLKEIRKELPDYDYLYLGDTLHVPYGNRSDETVFELTKKACDYLFDQGCKLIIIACNTASAKALRKLQGALVEKKQENNKTRKHNIEEVNILGVIRPVAEYFSALPIERIGVIGTRGTIQSNIYEQEIRNDPLRPRSEASQTPMTKSKSNHKILIQQETPLLVPLIEENWAEKKETTTILAEYLKPMQENKVEALILGCTHYPLLINQIKGIMGEECQVPNPGEIVAKSLKDYLQRHSEIETGLAKNQKVEYSVTDLNENFQKVAKQFIGDNINIKKVYVS